jgi:hypothetical protein
MMEPGKMRCGYRKASPSVCGNEVAVEGENGKRYVETTLSVGSPLVEDSSSPWQTRRD